MKRLDDDKISLVEFLSSIKFSQQHGKNHGEEFDTRLAKLQQRVRTRRLYNAEELELIRSAN
jgi:hypothetical protein